MPIEFKVGIEEGDDQRADSFEEPKESVNAMCTCKILPNTLNSSCMVSFTHMPSSLNEVSLIAAL